MERSNTHPYSYYEIIELVMSRMYNIHGFNYELDCTQWNGIYRKSYKEWILSHSQYI